MTIEEKLKDNWMENSKDYKLDTGVGKAFLEFNDYSGISIKFLDDLCSGKFEGILSLFDLEMVDSTENFDDTRQYGYPLIVNGDKFVMSDGLTAIKLYGADCFLKEDAKEIDGVLYKPETHSFRIYYESEGIEYLKRYTPRIANKVREIEDEKQRQDEWQRIRPMYEFRFVNLSFAFDFENLKLII